MHERSLQDLLSPDAVMNKLYQLRSKGSWIPVDHGEEMIQEDTDGECSDFICELVLQHF